MKEEIIKIVDAIKAKGYKIDVIDKRPPYFILRTDTLESDNNTEFENLTNRLKYLVFYKSDSLNDSLFKMRKYLVDIERLEHLKLYGEYSKDIQDIAAHILKENGNE